MDYLSENLDLMRDWTEQRMWEELRSQCDDSTGPELAAMKAFVADYLDTPEGKAEIAALAAEIAADQEEMDQWP